MKYIKIKNQGLIEIAALHLVGASTKRNDSSKIGQFGSGNKYAMAFLLREGYNLRVFSGLNEIKITTEVESFRDTSYSIIYLNGTKTSITTDMGKDWQFWQAIREIYCNALDEGECSLDFVQTVQPKENETHFYIDTKKDVTEFVANFDNYFATNKKVLFECDAGRILEKSGDKCNIYRRGIRCHNTNHVSRFDYDFNDIIIGESRLVSYAWQVEEKIWDLIFQCDNKEIIMQILMACNQENFQEGTIGDISTITPEEISETFKECIREINICPKGFAGLLKPDEVHNHVILPTKVYYTVRGLLTDSNVGDKFKIGRGGSVYREVQMSGLHRSTLTKALDFLNESGFDIPYPITEAIFDNKEVLGFADGNKIILSDICISKGVNEVVNTIIEEFIHLKYDVKDETRGFQTAIITEFVEYMKKKNAYVV